MLYCIAIKDVVTFQLVSEEERDELCAVLDTQGVAHTLVNTLEKGDLEEVEEANYEPLLAPEFYERRKK